MSFKYYLALNLETLYIGHNSRRLEEREMITGSHFVRDVFCKRCRLKLGWIYEMAVQPAQRYKEGCVILEKALITRQEGIDEISDSG